MILNIVGGCPICPGSGELIALQDKITKNLFFYCPSCESAWDHIPREVDEVNTLSSFAPSGFLAAPGDKLLSVGLNNFETTDMYEIVNNRIE